MGFDTRVVDKWDSLEWYYQTVVVGLGVMLLLVGLNWSYFFVGMSELNGDDSLNESVSYPSSGVIVESDYVKYYGGDLHKSESSRVLYDSKNDVALVTDLLYWELDNRTVVEQRFYTETSDGVLVYERMFEVDGEVMYVGEISDERVRILSKDDQWSDKPVVYAGEEVYCTVGGRMNYAIESRSGHSLSSEYFNSGVIHSKYSFSERAGESVTYYILDSGKYWSAGNTDGVGYVTDVSGYGAVVVGEDDVLQSYDLTVVERNSDEFMNVGGVYPVVGTGDASQTVRRSYDTDVMSSAVTVTEPSWVQSVQESCDSLDS